MGLQKEIWLKHIVEELFADNSFMSKAFNADEFVKGGKVVHIPNAGALPGVEMNRNSLPAEVKHLQDKDLTFVIDEFTTDPVIIKNAEKYEYSYDKRESVIGRSKKVLMDRVAKNFILKWSPTGGKNILYTTGAEVAAYTPGATGKRRSFTRQDARRLDKKFNAMDIPQEGRHMLLDAEMYDQLLESLTEAQQNAFLACADAEKGIVGKLYSFNVMLRSTVGVYGDNKEPKVYGVGGAAGDLPMGLAWHEGCVCRALGENEFFDNPGQATYYGDLLSFLVRAGGSPMATDFTGVFALLGSNATTQVGE